MTAPHPEGAGAAAAIAAGLEDAGLDADGVSFINAHGTGTPLNDTAEAHAVRTVFGDRAASLPVTGPKGALGHLLGASGAIEGVALVLALLDGAVQPTAGDDPADPDLGVDLVVGGPRPLPRDAVGVSTSLAFGGANAAVVLAGPESD
jgi:3-oxoacyl-[acyl-carrier-protein] synthase II